MAMDRRILLFVLGALVLCPFNSGANVVGTGAQNFNTTTSGIDFVTVHSSETLKPGIVNVGIFFNYAINSLPYIQNTSQGRTNFNDTLLGADFNIGLGLSVNWDVGISFPLVLAQSVSADQVFHGEFTKKGLTEIRLNTKYQFVGNDSEGFGAVASVNFNQMRNNPYKGNPANPTFNFELVGDITINDIALGVNLGHRWTFPGPKVSGAPFEPISNQIIASIAASYFLSGIDTKLIGEIFGSVPVKGSSSDIDRQSSSLEILAGVKHAFTHTLAIHGGLGTELLHGVASPDWRIYTGINISLLPKVKEVEVTRVEPPEESPKEPEHFIIENILFEFDSHEMVSDYRLFLDQIVEQIKSLPSFSKLIIEGHTDSIGDDEYNRDLSQKRADAIRKVLIEVYRLSAKKVEAKGLGESEPIADNGNFQGRQRNRRVEIKIIR